MTETVAHASGLAIHCACEQLDGLLPKQTEIHVYRIIQEALSNAVRHASAGLLTWKRSRALTRWANAGAHLQPGRPMVLPIERRQDRDDPHLLDHLLTNT